MSMMKKVQEFNFQVLGVPQRELCMMPQEEMQLSLVQLREEIQEMEDKYKEGDFVGVIDGMIDLQYFLFGVVYKHGIPEYLWEKMFKAVHEANMEKKLGVKKERGDFGAADAIKPEGWVPPEQRLQELLDDYYRDASSHQSCD